MKKQIKKLTSIMFAVSLILCIIGCKKEPEFNILDYVYTVSFESNGGTEIDSQTVVLGETVENPGEPEFKEKPETKIFAGWYTDKELKEEYDFSAKVENSFTLYAKWVHVCKGLGEWKNNDGEHYKLCDCGSKQNSGKCNYEDKEIIEEATCAQEGKKRVYCTVCKYEKEETIPVKGHSYSGSWTKDASGHWYECECGAKKDFEEHTYGTWKVEQEPTTNAEGKNERTCSNCGYVDSVVLQPAPKGFRFVKGATVTGALPAWLDESVSDQRKGVFIEGRTVTLSDFYIGKYEVTQEEYASVMEGQKVTVNETEYTLASDPSYCKEDSTSYTLFNGDVQEKRPVENVTWYDAVWYCNALSTKEGLTPAYDIEVTWVDSNGTILGATVTLVENATGYRLPTEAEWEYAARGGDPTAADWNYVFSGADTAEGVSYSNDKNAGLDSVGWYCYNNITGTTGDSDVTLEVSGKGTHQVVKKAPNRLGLYDMSGNVREWCYDRYETVNTGEESGPTGAASGSIRVYRGGSWGLNARFASVCYRYFDLHFGRRNDFGFRVVRQAN